MRYFYIYICIAFSLSACNRSFTVYDIEGEHQKFTPAYTDKLPEIETAIAPYRMELEASMNETVVIASGDLPKAQPSSPLGNLLADATKEMASTLLNKDIEVGIMNYGGIRVPSISQGNVSIGNVYEVMPFDNYLVVLNLNGEQLSEVCHTIAAKGGWPVAGLRFKIDEGRAKNILINGKAIDSQMRYTVAISDYLANGGDNLSMLKGLPQVNTNVLLRDAFMDYFRRINDDGDQLPVNNEIRVSHE